MNLHTKVFRAALEDKDYLADLAILGDKPPSKYFADDIAKGIWGSSYLGWLMGKHGPVKGKRIYEDIKRS